MGVRGGKGETVKERAGGRRIEIQKGEVKRKTKREAIREGSRGREGESVMLLPEDLRT